MDYDLEQKGPSASAHTTRHRKMATLSIDMLAWRTFVTGKNLHVGQLVLIVLRESNDSIMQVLFEIQLVI